jgi:hypothetical protein
MVETEYATAEHTYRRPGRFQATVQVHGNRGQTTSHTTQIVVLPLASFDAELREHWTAMKTAILRSDLPAALECVRSRNRRAVRQRLEALSSGGPTSMNRELNDISLAEVRATSVIYHMRRPNGVSEVRFSVDDDGVWRVEQF